MAPGPSTAPGAPPTPAPASAGRPLAANRPPRLLAPCHTPRVSVVIVNYCQWRNTLRLTRQLRNAACVRTGEAEVVVIDNHSPPHQAVTRLRRTTGVSLRRFSRNRGFASAVNEGCRLGGGDWLLLLNPDMSVAPDFLDQVASLANRVIQDDERAGVIGFRLRHPDGSPQASCGPFPTFLNTVGGLLRSRAVRKCRLIGTHQRTRVSWVTGCCLLVRRECLQDVGGFDEDYFLYYEDADLCLRARERGWNVWFDPSLEVTHHSPLHLRRVPAALRLMTRHALLTYGAKHWPRWQSVLLGGLVWLEAGCRQVRAWARGERDEMRYHRELRKLVSDLLTDRLDAVKGRIRGAAGVLEYSSSAQDGNAC